MASRSFFGSDLTPATRESTGHDVGEIWQSKWRDRAEYCQRSFGFVVGSYDA